MYIEQLLEKKPIIAAIKKVSDIDKVPIDKIDILFILRGKISNLVEMVNRAIEKDKLIFLHIDMAKGIRRDKEGVKYLAREVGIDGIVTTKGRLIKEAKKEGLITVQRLFLLDSESLITGFNMINYASPDLVEVLPGPAVTELMEELTDEIEVPIIAGGLIKRKGQVEKILKSGAVAVSTSKKLLWESDYNVKTLCEK